MWYPTFHFRAVSPRCKSGSFCSKKSSLTSGKAVSFICWSLIQTTMPTLYVILHLFSNIFLPQFPHEMVLTLSDSTGIFFSSPRCLGSWCKCSSSKRQYRGSMLWSTVKVEFFPEISTNNSLTSCNHLCNASADPAKKYYISKIFCDLWRKGAQYTMTHTIFLAHFSLT